MAAPTNALLTTGGSALTGMREDLSDVVAKIGREETPFYSWCRKGTAKNDLAHDWMTITYRAPVKNARAEADVYESSAPRRGIRLTNACQIVDDVAEVSETAEAVDSAGDIGKLDEQVLIKSVELKKDLEFALLGNAVAKITDPREMAGIQTFAGVASVGAGGTKPTGDGATLVVAGTERALSQDIGNTVMSEMWASGGMPGVLMGSMGQKLAFDALLPDEQQLSVSNSDTRSDGAILTTTVSIWRSAFGDIKLVANPVMGIGTLALDGILLVLDDRETMRPKVCPLPGKDWHSIELAKTHRTERKAVGWEGTLEVPNPKGVGLIAGLSDAYSS